MERIVCNRPASNDWVTSVQLDPNRPVQYSQQPAVPQDVVVVPICRPERQEPVAIGRLFSEVLARYGLASPETMRLAQAADESVELVA